MQKPSEKIRKIILLVVTWCALFGFFLGYEHYFVDGQREYLIDRDFRNLSRFCIQLSAEFERARRSVISLAKTMKWLHEEKNRGVLEPEALAYSGTYLDKIWDGKIPSQAFLVCLAENSDKIGLAHAQNSTGLSVLAKCPPGEDPQAKGSPRTDQSEPSLRLDMKPWVQNAFLKYKDSFEDVLVADETGRVLFQQSASGPQITDLGPILASGTDINTKQKVFGFLGGTSQDSSTQSGTSKSSEESVSTRPAPNTPATSPPEKPGRLSLGSSATRVAIEGKNYLLFTQPAPVILGNGPEAGNHWNLVLVGLRLASKMDAQSHSMPYSVLIWLTLCGVVLLGFSWPWFKLQYMSNTERFRPRDGWLLAFTLLLICSGMMLILLNASYLESSRERADEALKKLGDQMKAKFDLEVSRALRQLEEIQSTEQFEAVFSESKKYNSLANYPIENDVGRSYPYFEIVFWGDDNGHQVAKLDVREVATPPVNLTPFQFYQSVVSELKWARLSDGKETQRCLSVSNDQDLKSCSYFQPILSPNTDEFAPVLATPFHLTSNRNPTPATDRIVVQALVFRPMSIIAPVFPPGYGFAIVDHNCQVLFHSDSFRDMRENFCEESRKRSELHPWLFAGTSAALDITYGGKEERAYLTNFPLPGLTSGQRTYLLVFQEGDHQLTLDLAVNLVCSILLAFYFLILVIAAAGHLILRGPLQWNYAPRVVWPCREFAMRYLQIICMSVFLCLLYRNLYPRLYEAQLVGLTLGVVLLSILFALIRLATSSEILFGVGVAAGTLAVLAWAVLLVTYLMLRRNITLSELESIKEWSTLPSLLLAFGLFAILVSNPFHWFTRLFDRNETFRNSFGKLVSSRSNLLYSTAVVSLIACASLVPCAGFFKYAYDAINEISLKHDEAVLADRLLDRKDRIANYYKRLNARHIAEGRLLESLDRYDKDEAGISPAGGQLFFHSCNEPTLQNDASKSACPSNTQDHVDFGLNDWIEKQIGRATLTFPSNELGSEISRLGIAETDEPSSWEHFWVEPSATTFALRYKEKSRAPFFGIWATYPEWKGLRTWERVGLYSLLIILVLWLINLSSKVFLTNVESPQEIEMVKWEQVSDIKRDSLVIGLPRSGKSTQLKKLKGLDPRDFRDLRDFQSERSEVSKLCEPESPDCHSGVIILDQFDFSMKDAAWNKKRLELIEKLLSKTDRKLVLVSTIDLLYFLVEERGGVLSKEEDPKEIDLLLERWARALDGFSRVKLPSAVDDEFAERTAKFLARGGPSAEFAKWICDECASTPMLQRIGVEVLDKFSELPFSTCEQLVGLVADRAEAYYRMLWAGLTSSERLSLYQLALDGWANPKNAPALRRLEQKQLIFRRPMYRIMNDSFRSFIRSAEHEKEILEWQAQEQDSTWRILRFILLAAIIGAGVWLLYAQAQLFQIGTGYITALATLLTAIAGFAARTKKPSSPAQADSGTGS